jgi:hypothetical protein
MKFKGERREKKKRKGRGSQRQTNTVTTTSVVPRGRGCRDATNNIVEFGVTSQKGVLHAARIEQSRSIR